MTNEEALNILHNSSVYHPMYLDALNMAIKALEQQLVLDKIKAEIREWYWQADKQALAKDPCVVNAMIDLFIRTINKYKEESEASITLTRPIGKWIDIGNEGLVFKCSSCGDKNMIESHFCPNCGARMKVKKHDTYTSDNHNSIRSVNLCLLNHKNVGGCK